MVIIDGKQAYVEKHEEVRSRTRQQSMDNVLQERRLHWSGQVIRMDHQHIPQQALHCELPGFNRGQCQPRTNWRSMINNDLQQISHI